MSSSPTYAADIEAGQLTFQDSLNAGSPQSAHDAARIMRFGDVLRKHLKVDLRRQAPLTDAAQLGTVWSFPVDNEAPAATILRAYCRVGTVTGEYTPVAYGATPTTGQIAVAPNGNIVVLAADAPTDIDVEYMPSDGDVKVFANLPVVPGTGVCALPPAALTPGVVYLWDANVIVGTLLGRKNILVAAAGAPATGKARLDVAKGVVQFAVADAVTSATIALYLCTARNLDTLLQSTDNSLI